MADDNITVTRRANLRALYEEFARERLAADPSAHGLEGAFAQFIAVSASTWSMIKSSRPIGDRLARQIEVARGKPAGWLDQPHPELRQPDPAEERFVALARQAWRKANAHGKRELAHLLKSWKTGR